MSKTMTGGISGAISALRLKQATTTQRKREQVEVLETLRDEIAPTCLDFTQADAVRLSDTEWARAWYVGEWPDHIGAQLLHDLYTCQHVEGDLRISLGIMPHSGRAVSRQLANQATGIRAKQILRATRNLDPSPLDEARLDQLETERRLLEVHGDPFFEVTLTLVLFARSKQALDEQSLALEELCRGAGLEIRRARERQDLGLEAVMPLNSDGMRDYRRNMRKLALRNLFPFVGSELVMPNGVYFGCDMNAWSPVCFDPFRLTTPHIVIMGTSGAGKSVFMKDLLEQYVLDGTRCFVTDIEGEYTHLCDDLGGVYLDMSVTSRETVNVLDVSAEDEDGLEGAYSQFKGWVVGALGQGLDAAQDMTLANAHAAIFAARGFDRHDRRTFSNIPPVLADIYDTIERLPADKAPDDGARQRLLAGLYRFAKGGLSGVFSRQTTFSHRAAPLVVFGMSRVPQDLKRVRLRQIQQYTWAQHLDKSRRTVEFIDEAWHLLGQPETAQDLADRVVRLRKYNGAAVIATQQVEDFLKNDQARRVIGQASLQLIFKQRESSISAVAGLHALAEHERDALRLLKTGEYMLISGAYRSIISKNVPASRLALYDTRPDASAPPRRAVAQMEGPR
jgi:hypothetical protein